MRKSVEKEITIRDYGENADIRVPVKYIAVFFAVTFIIAGISFLYKPATAVGILFKVFICFCAIFDVMLSVFVLVHIFISRCYEFFKRL